MKSPNLKILQANATPEEAQAHLRSSRVADELKQLNTVSYSIKKVSG